MAPAQGRLVAARMSTNVLHRLEKDVFPLIGKYPLKELKAPVILDMLRQIERRGAVEMARRQAQVCGQIHEMSVFGDRPGLSPIMHER
jgi:hypothetical protein